MRRQAWIIAVLAVASAQAQNGPVIASGAMRDAMHGRYAGVIRTDSLTGPGTFGLGPLEYLRGELLIWDGHVFVAKATEGAMRVEERPGLQAPFFVHQRVQRWSEVVLPDTVSDLVTLDAFLSGRHGSDGKVFAFRLEGPFDTVAVHVLDVPEDTKVSSRAEAHAFDKHFARTELTVDVLGFFSTQHKGIFTHHDAHIHVHAITPQRDWMGHVEEMRFSAAKVRLYVATNR